MVPESLLLISHLIVSVKFFSPLFYGEVVNETNAYVFVSGCMDNLYPAR